jgi:hypothetical protein
VECSLEGGSLCVMGLSCGAALGFASVTAGGLQVLPLLVVSKNFPVITSLEAESTIAIKE